MASEESVKRWFHRFSKVFSVEKKFRNTVAVDETVVEMHVLEHMYGLSRRRFRGSISSIRLTE
jgi:hypothetical protein